MLSEHSTRVTKRNIKETRIPKLHKAATSVKIHFCGRKSNSKCPSSISYQQNTVHFQFGTIGRASCHSISVPFWIITGEKKTIYLVHLLSFTQLLMCTATFSFSFLPIYFRTFYVLSLISPLHPLQTTQSSASS